MKSERLKFHKQIPFTAFSDKRLRRVVLPVVELSVQNTIWLYCDKIFCVGLESGQSHRNSRLTGVMLHSKVTIIIAHFVSIILGEIGWNVNRVDL